MLPSSELELEMILMKLFWTTQEDVPEFLYKQSFILIKRRTFKKLISILFGTLQRELPRVQPRVVYYICVSFHIKQFWKFSAVHATLLVNSLFHFQILLILQDSC